MDIVRENQGGNVLIASHKATIRLLLSSLLGFDPRRYRDNLDQSPAALNIVDFKDAVRARLTLSTIRRIMSRLALPFPRCRRRACRSGGMRRGTGRPERGGDDAGICVPDESAPRRRRRRRRIACLPRESVRIQSLRDRMRNAARIP